MKRYEIRIHDHEKSRGYNTFEDTIEDLFEWFKRRKGDIIRVLEDKE